MSDPPAPADLRTEYATDAVGVEDAPRFGWNADGDATAAGPVEQTAYRVRVATDPAALDAVDGERRGATGDGEGSERRPGSGDEPVRGEAVGIASEGVAWDSGRVASARQVGVRYEGPPLDGGETYYWQVRVWDGDGDPSPYSDAAQFETALDPGDWEAAWIRRGPDGADAEFEDPEFQQLRTEFGLDGAVTRARAYVAAFHQCAVWLNGEEVGRGQSFCYPERQYYKTYDVTEHLREGENALGLLGVWTGWGKGRPEYEPGFLAQVEIEYEDGTTETVVTDGSWRVRDGPWEDTENRSPPAREPIERVDGRERAAGWTDPGFDDSEWEDPDVVGTHPAGPWEHLLPQKRAVVWHEREPEAVRRLDDGTYVADFGRVYAGVPLVTFADGEAGHRVDMRAGYRLDDDGHVSADRGVQWTDMSYEYVQREGEQTFRPFVFLGFRYLQIDDPGEDLDPRQVRMVARHTAVPDERAATFAAADDTLEEVWELARHSALYGSQEGFLDTPTREKGQFVGDALDISLTTMSAFRERTLTRQAIREFCRSQERYWAEEGRVNAVYPTGEGKRDIPDYTEMFVEWVWQYYRRTADRALLERAYPVLENVAAYVARHVDPETGLVTDLAGGGGDYEFGIVDWPAPMRYGYDMDTAARTTVNVLGWAVFDRVARAATALDEPAAAVEQWRERADALADAIDAQLTRDDGVYVDGLRADGTQSDHASQHANAVPLAFGLVPPERVDAVADHVVDRGMAMGPLTVYWLLRALDAAGRHNALVDLATDPSHDGWADILDRGGTFTWESWNVRDVDDERQRYILSESHAWAATVLVALQEALVGVRVADPGAARVTVAPPRGGPRWVEGRVPTERGAVAVSWEREGDALDLSVALPGGVAGTVRVPTDDPGGARVGVDGTTVWDSGPADALPAGVERVTADGETVVLDVAAGRYRVEREN